MRAHILPTRVNGRFGDPCVHLDFLFERRAMLFDLGDIAALPARKILRVSHVFVSHAHLDHFIGFDRLLRLLVGRERHIHLFGPPGFTERVEAKLRAYAWNLGAEMASDLVIDAHALHGAPRPETAETVRFRILAGFAPEPLGVRRLEGGTIHAEPAFAVRAATLDHRIPCLAFALEERAHLNVWRTRLDALGLATGPWLAGLKDAVRAGSPDETPIPVAWRRDAPAGPGTLPLGRLRRAVLSVSPGRKIAYVTDAAPTPANRSAIVDLARGAEILFIEAAFAAADTALAAARAHLTTAEAGALARAAGVTRVEPFHFSTRYEGEEARLLAEVERAFRGEAGGCGGQSA